MKSRTVVMLLLLAAPGAVAADTRPPAGSYGFNWLAPDSECVQLTDADVARFRSCEANSNAFGLDLESHACKVDADTELMVYATQAQCQQALETMQANGP